MTDAQTDRLATRIAQATTLLFAIYSLILIMFSSDIIFLSMPNYAVTLFAVQVSLLLVAIIVGLFLKPEFRRERAGHKLATVLFAFVFSVGFGAIATGVELAVIRVFGG
jgi:hypothetical protein